MTINGVPDGMHETRAALVLRDAHSTPRFWYLQTRFNKGYDDGWLP